MEMFGINRRRSKLTSRRRQRHRSKPDSSHGLGKSDTVLVTKGEQDRAGITLAAMKVLIANRGEWFA